MIEKSKDMEKRYEGGVDTWGNRERQLYQKIFKEAVKKVLSLPNLSTLKKLMWYDIGAGGGNIWDTIRENQGDQEIVLRGCDLSDVAVTDLNERYQDIGASATHIDLEEYRHDHYLCTEDAITFYSTIKEAHVVSLVDVAYYFGDKRPWKETMDEIWKSIAPETIVVVADSLIPYQRRSYFSTKKDCTTLYDYIDYSEKVSTETRDNGRAWHRYLKVKIYKKEVTEVNV